VRGFFAKVVHNKLRLTLVSEKTGKERVFRIVAGEGRDEAQGQVGPQGGVTRMALRSADRETIEAEIDRVRSLGLDELRNLWRTILRPSPPLPSPRT
jgi:hypothetical protein